MGLQEVKDKPIPRCKPAISQVVDLVIALLFLFPEGEVLLEELNDALGISEVVFFELVDLVEGILECLVSEVDSGLAVDGPAKMGGLSVDVDCDVGARCVKPLQKLSACGEKLAADAVERDQQTAIRVRRERKQMSEELGLRRNAQALALYHHQADARQAAGLARTPPKQLEKQIEKRREEADARQAAGLARTPPKQLEKLHKLHLEQTSAMTSAMMRAMMRAVTSAMMRTVMRAVTSAMMPRAAKATAKGAARAIAKGAVAATANGATLS